MFGLSTDERNPTSSVETVIDVSVIAVLLAVLLRILQPHLLFSSTITTGGDTPSHYFTLRYLKDVLLPQGRLSGWTPSHYAGFPILQNYFPLPFLIMVALSFVVGLPIAFKVGTVLGLFLLPGSAYLCLRFMRFAFPVPVVGATAMWLFLFIEGNSQWGGNISSTLAGEFAYSLGLSLALIGMGMLFHGIRSNRWLMMNAGLLALIGMSHGCALLFVACWSLVFLLDRNHFTERFFYLLKMHAVAGLLMSFWLLPLIHNQPWTTPFNILWVIHSWQEILPKILWPALVLIIPGLWGKPRPAVYALVTGIGVAGYLFYVAPRLGVADIRFVPFAQVLVLLIAAVGVGTLTQRQRGKPLVPVIILLATLGWVDKHSASIPSWVEWNYSGFEGKKTWPDYSAINHWLSGTVQDPRVVYENAGANNIYGSLRAWESLPLFSGRSTLEHAYLQASPTSPFVFYLQSEISREASCPFPEYACTTVHFEQAAKHLNLFNVSQLIAITDSAKTALAALPEYHLQQTIGACSIFGVAGSHHYVEPLINEPVLWTGGDWKSAAYTWFRHLQWLDVPLVFPIHFRRADEARFPLRTATFERPERHAIDAPDPVLWERVSNDEIAFATHGLHKPYLIKFSFHPNWRVEGARRIYLVSPSFMLVYPDQEQVRLYYTRSAFDRVALGLTFVGLGIVGWSLKKRRSLLINPGITRLSPVYGVGVMIALSSAAGTLLALAILSHERQPQALLDHGVRSFQSKQWAQAERYFHDVIRYGPVSGQAEHAYFDLAMAAYLQNHWQDCLDMLGLLADHFPDTSYRAEMYFHEALCDEYLGRHEDQRHALLALRREFPQSVWAGYAAQRWPHLTD